MKILNNISGWFAGLQPRERLIITLGTALLFVAALYMALLPAMQKNAELEQRYASLSDDLVWLKEQSAVVSRLNNSCSGQAMQSGKKKEVITRIARRNQIKLFDIDNSESLYSFSVSAPSANRVLQLAYQLTCQGLALENLSVTSSSDSKEVYIADIEVMYVD
jgi:type II secretory pathway component PulM